MKKVLSFALLSLILVTPALAAVGDPAFINITTKEQLVNKIYQIFNVVFSFLIIIAVAFILYAGFTYVTAGGDKTKIDTANKMIIYAAAGVLVALFAKAIPTVVANIFN